MACAAARVPATTDRRERICAWFEKHVGLPANGVGNGRASQEPHAEIRPQVCVCDNLCQAGAARSSSFVSRIESRPSKRQDRRCREVVADVLQSVVCGQPGGDVRRQRSAQDAGEVEGQRAAGVTHRRRKEFGNHRAERAVGQAHQRQAQCHHRHRPGGAGNEHRRHHQAEQADRDGYPEQHAAAAALRQNRGDRNGQREEGDVEQLHQQKLLAAVAERAGAPRQREDRHQVEEHERREADHDARDQRFGVVAKNRQHRHLHLLAPAEGFPEHGRLGDRQRT